MRLIDISPYDKDCRIVLHKDDCGFPVKDLPTIDAVEVVRCKDCKHSIDYYNDGGCYCRKPHADDGLDYIFGGWNWFCADGERKEGSE